MSIFKTPLSNTEKILQNMLGADNKLDEPRSRVEELLMQLLEEGPKPTPEEIREVIEEYIAEHPEVLTVDTDQIVDLAVTTIKIGDKQVTIDKLSQSLQDLLNSLDTKPIIYGFHIDSTEEDSDNCITYLNDAVGMAPAYMDFTNDKWEWGSWEDAFFMPKPCMVGFDGKVKYYLDPTDLEKKIDGTASDISDETYPGNAMMEWPKVWMKIVPDPDDDSSANIYFSDKKVDSNYTCYPYIDANGDEIDHMYTAIFNGSLDTNNILRSISGKQVMASKTATQEISYADANNTHNKTEWNIETYSDWLQISLLTVLITKSLDCKSKIGQGINTGGQTTCEAYRTGALNTKGLFYGSTSTSVAVKVFGMENFYALQWRRKVGHMSVAGVQKIKLCYGTSDGSTTSSYNTTGADYITVNETPIFAETGSGWLKKMKFGKTFMVPKEDSGASNKTYKAYSSQNITATTMSLVGGYSASGSYVSVFCVRLLIGPSTAAWSLGASLSLKPLAA